MKFNEMRILQLVIITANVLSAQTTPHKAATPTTTPKAAPAGIPNTDDIESLVHRLIASGSKSEFETSQQFQDRQSKLLPTDNRYTFVLDYNKDFNEAYFKYDADTSTMKASISIEPLGFRPDYDKRPTIQVKYKLERDVRHVGMNGYGAQAVFITRNRNDFGVIPTRESISWLRTFSTSTLSNDLPEVIRQAFRDQESDFETFSVPLTADYARSAKPNLRLVIIGSVPDAQVHLDDSFYPATVSDPIEGTIKKFYLDFSISEVRVVDSRTGKVLAAFVR
jgi:hypothetical protein